METTSLPPLESYLATDCEMVGVRSGQVLAKIGIVDHAGAVVLESFVYVNPKNVIDWRSDTSGVRPGDLDGAPTFEVIQQRVKELVKDKIIVGHAVFNDLSAIQHRHPYELIRDTALYYPLRQLPGINIHREGEYPSLKKLCKEILGKDIQKGDHDPVEDARATMAIFMTVREGYEASLLNGEEVVSGLPAAYEKWYW